VTAAVSAGQTLRDAAAAMREEPAHYFDCDRLQVYDYGARYGTCDCKHSAVALAVADWLDAEATQCEESERINSKWPEGRGPWLADPDPNALTVARTVLGDAP